MEERKPMMDEREPMSVACTRCSHHWIGFWLPMQMSKVVAILQSIRCPKCAATSEQIVAVPDPKGTK